MHVLVQEPANGCYAHHMQDPLSLDTVLLPMQVQKT